MLLNRISATVVGLALLTGTVVVPALAQQEVTQPEPVPAEVPPEPIQGEVTPPETAPAEVPPEHAPEETPPDPAQEEVPPPSAAQDDSTENALQTDAAMYAADWGVSQEEAVRRLSLQDEIGKLNAILTEEEGDTFAGLWIEHAPEYRVVVWVKRPFSREQKIRSYVRGTNLEGLVQVSSARFSKKRLQAAQAVLRRLAERLNVPVDSEIDLQANRVRLYTLNPDLLKNLRQRVRASVDLDVGVAEEGVEDLLDEGGVEVVQVERLSTPEVDIHGGLPLSGCTSGFSVRNSRGTRGITTAAHCPNSQSYNRRSLTFQSEDQEGNQDVQWHSAPRIVTVTNQFDSGMGVRRVTATRSRGSQAEGGYVCKNGGTTGYTCGNISSTTFRPSYVTNAASTFIRVHNNSNENLSEGGDSGGPWFNGNTAYGTHSGSPGDNLNDAIYMPINYVDGIGVSVLTSP